MLALALLIAIAVVFIVAAAVLINERRELKTTEVAKGARNNLPVFSPLAGTAVPLSEVPEAAFAKGFFDRGLAIRPDCGAVLAPFDATIITTSPIGHVVRLRHHDGAELLICIGVNAVMLSGQYFDLKVNRGQLVKAGELIVEFDYETITGAGYDTVATVTMTNAVLFPRVTIMASGPMSHGEILLMAIAAQNCTDE